MATTEAKHTPTPWVVEENVRAGGIMHLAVTNRAAAPDWMPCSITPMHMVREVDRANAEHIVRCVNLHDELVTALRAALSGSDDTSVNFKHLMDAVPLMRAVLAKAEGSES